MRVLVTGGSGFVGSALARALAARGLQVRLYQRSALPWAEQSGLEVVRGELTDPPRLAAAVAGCQGVFHTAAKVGVWGKLRDFEQVNVRGTEALLAACRAAGVQRLVFTSTPSVVFDGRDQDGIDESTPYPTRHLAAYSQTKARAEQMVLAANDRSLATVALRPHLIWGPGDPHLVRRLIERARAGRLWLVAGGRQLVDSTYIDNAVLAHLLADEQLQTGKACAGRAYFISNGEPMPLAELINRILAAAGLSPVRRSMPASLAYALGAGLEWLGQWTGRADEPPMTRFVARQLATAHWYRLDAARRDLGYTPQVTIAQGLERLAQSLRADQADRAAPANPA